MAVSMSRLSNLSGSGGVITVPATLTSTGAGVTPLTIQPFPGQTAPLVVINGNLVANAMQPGSVQVGTSISLGTDLILIGNTPATNIANVNSGNMQVVSKYWDGAASQSDTWNIQSVLGTGANPRSSLTVTHTGSTGEPSFNLGPGVDLEFNGINSPGQLAVTITLTSAQILALAGTPIQVLPAPGANKIYQIVHTMSHYRFNTTAYTLGAMTAIVLSFSTAALGIFGVVGAAGMLDQVADKYEQGTNLSAIVGVAAVNAPLFAIADANPTLGNGTVTLTIDYEITDVTTI
jgi:hypothetical protein